MVASFFLFSAIAWYSQNRYYIPYAWVAYAIPAVAISIGLLVQIDNSTAVILFKFALIITVGTLLILCLSDKRERTNFRKKLQLLIAR
jgi:hypothetical protein